MKLFRSRVLIFNEKQEDLTGNSTEEWVDCAVNLEEVSAVRKSIDNGREGNAVVHFKHGDYFILDDEYDKVVDLIENS